MKIGDTVILKTWHKAIVVHITETHVIVRRPGHLSVELPKSEILRVETPEDRRGECS